MLDTDKCFMFANFKNLYIPKRQMLLSHLRKRSGGSKKRDSSLHTINSRATIQPKSVWVENLLTCHAATLFFFSGTVRVKRMQALSGCW